MRCSFCPPPVRPALPPNSNLSRFESDRRRSEKSGNLSVYGGVASAAKEKTNLLHAFSPAPCPMSIPPSSTLRSPNRHVEISLHFEFQALTAHDGFWIRFREPCIFTLEQSLVSTFHIFKVRPQTREQCRELMSFQMSEATPNGQGRR